MHGVFSRATQNHIPLSCCLFFCSSMLYFSFLLFSMRLCAEYRVLYALMHKHKNDLFSISIQKLVLLNFFPAYNSSYLVSIIIMKYICLFKNETFRNARLNCFCFFILLCNYFKNNNRTAIVHTRPRDVAHASSINAKLLHKHKKPNNTFHSLHII